jgi:hypothetical protein
MKYESFSYYVLNFNWIQQKESEGSHPLSSHTWLLLRIPDFLGHFHKVYVYNFKYLCMQDISHLICYGVLDTGKKNLSSPGTLPKAPFQCQINKLF